MGDPIRRILEEQRGRFVSGQEIAGRLGTTRAAVWKRVRTLRRNGYAIEGARGTGYRLLDAPDRIDERELFDLLPPGTSWSSLVSFDVTDSTNSRAMEMAGGGARHGTVVAADAQTGGRGRFGRRWESPPGKNLYVSLILRPPIEPPEAPRLTLVAAIALAAAVEEAAGLAVMLKWPNDLFIGGRKAAGILAEMAADPDVLQHVVVGVGLNVNAGEDDFPEELRARATSLRIETGRTFRRIALLAGFLARFEADCRRYVAEGFGALRPEWTARSLLDGKRVRLALRGREEEGTAEGIDASGALLFRPDGAPSAVPVHGGEILAFER